ncbi:NAD(+)--rifampin ADP-ribosyltransferase [Aeromicrobium sp. 179-A 4D2 NHS]|uniref:NAD(+)--rifampin ADP-ribosyltransferase n=1 Tax=Aeromicrobium sp. 179-A 4D2 NHS TaxID=3142375 RepID=UPI0039A1BDCC
MGQQARGASKPGTNRGSFIAKRRPEADPMVTQEDWRSRKVTVEGRQFTYGDVYGGRLFHGSRHELADGDMLEPGRSEANFTESAEDAVSITSEADTALFWANESTDDPVYVYEIEPEGPIVQWRSMLANCGQNWRLQEGRVPAARIVRRIDLQDAREYQRALTRGDDPLPRS